MSAADEALVEFMRDIGLGDIAEPLEYPLTLKFETRGRLFFEPASESLLMYLESSQPVDRPGVLERALRRSDVKSRQPLAVHSCLARNDHLVLALKLPIGSLSLQVLHQGVELLSSLEREILAS